MRYCCSYGVRLGDNKAKITTHLVVSVIRPFALPPNQTHISESHFLLLLCQCMPQMVVLPMVSMLCSGWHAIKAKKYPMSPEEEEEEKCKGRWSKETTSPMRILDNARAAGV